MVSATTAFGIAVIILVLVILVWKVAGVPQKYVVVTGSEGLATEIYQRRWKVSAEYDNREDAAALLHRTHVSMLKLMRHLKKKYKIDCPDDQLGPRPSYDVQMMLQALLKNYNPDVFYENDPKKSTDTAYTLDKGTAMYICLRSRTDPTKLVDPDTLLFVVIHEASHIANYNGWGHTQRFWTIFKFLLEEAHECGIYNPVDFSRAPDTYCGLEIVYNPMLDKSLPSYYQRETQAMKG